jgi:hypothetical protein
MAKDKKDKEAADKAMREYRAARAALDANCRRERAAGIRDETSENRRLNRQVADAEKRVPFWKR